MYWAGKVKTLDLGLGKVMFHAVGARSDPLFAAKVLRYRTRRD